MEVRGGPVLLRIDFQPTIQISPPSVKISVIDQGQGIAEADRHKVFEGPYRSDHHLGTQGMGLGLMISRKLAQRLGGSLHLLDQSQPGCHFPLQIPLRMEDHI